MTGSPGSISMLTLDGASSTALMSGTGTGGTTNAFPSPNFNSTGRAGRMIDTGNGKARGASRTITLAHKHSDRSSGNKGNRNINRDPRSSNTSDRDNNRFSNKDSFRFSTQDHNLRREVSNHMDNLRREVSELRGVSKDLRSSGQGLNLRREVCGPRDKTKDLRLSNKNTHSLKEDLKGGGRTQ